MQPYPPPQYPPVPPRRGSAGDSAACMIALPIAGVIWCCVTAIVFLGGGFFSIFGLTEELTAWLVVWGVDTLVLLACAVGAVVLLRSDVKVWPAVLASASVVVSIVPIVIFLFWLDGVWA